jgi:hypothetical protein
MNTRFSRREFMMGSLALSGKDRGLAFFPPGTNAERMALMVGEVLEK